MYVVPLQNIGTQELKKKNLYEGSRCWNTLWTFKYLAESLILHSTCAYISVKQICAAEFSMQISTDFGLVNLPLAAHIHNKWTNTREVYDTSIMAIVLKKKKKHNNNKKHRNLLPSPWCFLHFFFYSLYYK